MLITSLLLGYGALFKDNGGSIYLQDEDCQDEEQHWNNRVARY